MCPHIHLPLPPILWFGNSRDLLFAAVFASPFPSLCRSWSHTKPTILLSRSHFDTEQKGPATKTVKHMWMRNKDQWMRCVPCLISLCSWLITTPTTLLSCSQKRDRGYEGISMMTSSLINYSLCEDTGPVGALPCEKENENTFILERSRLKMCVIYFSIISISN